MGWRSVRGVSSQSLEKSTDYVGPGDALHQGMRCRKTNHHVSWSTSPFHPSLVSDEELVACLLALRPGGGSRQRAATLLKQVGGLAGLARIGPCYAPMTGVTANQVYRLAAALELGLRCAEPSLTPTSVVTCAEDIVAILGPRFRLLQHEQVWLLGMNARNVVTSRWQVAKGGQHGCALLARDVLRVAVQAGAQCFVLAHNHPGGDPRPSVEDVTLTEKLAVAALCIGIPLLDHVIVAQGGHVSMLQMGLIPEVEQEATCGAVPRHASFRMDHDESVHGAD